jgi:diguanylate cyclase (GGDEF)-like protein
VRADVASTLASSHAPAGPFLTGRLWPWLAGAAGAVAVVILLDSSGVLAPDAEVALDNTAQLVAGIAAAVACLVTARRLGGPEQAWRLWMGAGMVGWSVGQAFWAYYQVIDGTSLPSPSVADIGYLTMPVMAVPALLSLAVQPPRHTAPGERHVALVLVLDGLIVVGSLFAITWATSLGAVVDLEVANGTAFAVAVAYPATDLMLVVIVVLSAVTRRVPQQLRPELWLLGAGLVAIAVSDSIFAYIVANGLDEMPPVTNAGFVLGPLLVAVAAVNPGGRARAARAELHAHPTVERAHLLLPYALVAVSSTLLAAQAMLHMPLDTVEVLSAWGVLVLAMVRQTMTLVVNTSLLDRVTAAQAELAFRAHHDPLTGLANRALLNERLVAALDRSAHSEPVALLVIDLDDFKVVNDTFGHGAGDRLLQAVGERLRGCVRAGDTVARLGGDEFAVVLEAGAEAPGIVAQRILVALRQPFAVERRLLSLGASVGVVEYGDEPGLTPDVLLHRADHAMYAGKRRGKGVTVHYRPDLDGGVDGGPGATADPPQPSGGPDAELSRR